MVNKDDVKSRSGNRINIIKGQLDGLLRMIEKDVYCVEILDQSLAIQNSLKSLDSLILERHMKIHVVDQFKTNKDVAILELVGLFKKNR